MSQCLPPAGHTLVRPLRHDRRSHEVTNVGHDRGQLSKSERAQDATGHDALTVIADRDYFKGENILACEQPGMTPYVAKPLTSGAKAEGRFGKQDFIYVAEDNTTTLERTSAFG